MLCSYTGQLRPRFSTTVGKEGTRSTVYLPNNCPVSAAVGHFQSKRPLAVSSACLEAIKMLHQARLPSALFCVPGCISVESFEMLASPTF